LAGLLGCCCGLCCACVWTSTGCAARRQRARRVERVRLCENEVLPHTRGRLLTMGRQYDGVDGTRVPCACSSQHVTPRSWSHQITTRAAHTSVQVVPQPLHRA
jgi:hypothetical protein